MQMIVQSTDQYSPLTYSLELQTVVILDSFNIVTSPKNQRIEASWSFLGREKMAGGKDFSRHGRSEFIFKR